jgi:hypothetical protein
MLERLFSLSEVAIIRRRDCDVRSLIALAALAIEREFVAEFQLL